MVDLSELGLIQTAVRLPRLSGHVACNPSLIVQGERRIIALYKGINYDLQRNGYRPKYAGMDVSFSDSQNYLAELDTDLRLLSADFIEDRHLRASPEMWWGLQDLRLFDWRGRRWCLGVAITHEAIPGRSGHDRVERTVLCELVQHRLLLAMALPSRQRREKNWMPWVRGDELHVIYAQDPYEVWRLAEDTVSRVPAVQGHPALAGHFGGSAVVPWRGRYVALVHLKQPGAVVDTGTGKPLLRYTHRLVVYSASLDVLAVSAPFTFEGQRVEFACGLAVLGDDFVLGYGVWDHEAVLAKVSATALCERVGLSMDLFGPMNVRPESPTDVGPA